MRGRIEIARVPTAPGQEMILATPTAETISRIKRATRLRVEGCSWDQVAQHFPGEYVDGQSCRETICRDHKPEWDAEYELARSLYLNEIEAEATLTQRGLLRFNQDSAAAVDAHVRQSAAHSILNHTRQLRAQKVEISGPGGGAIPLGIVLDASAIDNGRPLEPAETEGVT